VEIHADERSEQLLIAFARYALSALHLATTIILHPTYALAVLHLPHSHYPPPPLLSPPPSSRPPRPPRFEERSKEFDRARVIYKFALENTAKEENVRELNKEYIAFEKRHGNRYNVCLWHLIDSDILIALFAVTAKR
jgi:hypothetical protein